MGILSIVLLVLFVIVSILLILMVVVQNEGSEGLGGIFAGSSSSAFGSRASNVMQRFTYVLGALFFICSFSLAMINKGSTGNVEAAALKQTQAPTASEWWKTSGNNAPATPAPAASGADSTAVPETAPASGN